tara:strand:- start:12 stop:320 length:309 start_codon:yes stop_codon:yes gene_type:complete
MTDFPTIMYRTPGPHKKPRGKTYAYKGAADQAEFDVLIAKGWFPSYEDAVVGKIVATVSEIDTVSPATRDELEAKAKELGVSFNARTSDKTIAERIASALEV